MGRIRGGKNSADLQHNESSGRMQGLRNFDYWRMDSRFWYRRATDIAAKSQPPLKHVGQNLFAMTIAGAAFLKQAEKLSLHVKLADTDLRDMRTMFETYPSCVAKRIGFKRSYKQHPVYCLNTAITFLAAKGIRLDFHEHVKRFCKVYRTGSQKDDPDGADSFLCLVGTICFHEGDWEMLRGDATNMQLLQEGGIIVPRSHSEL